MEIQVMTPSTELGEKIFLRRDSMGWSQVELARRSGVSRKAIVNTEGGKSYPTGPTLRRLARAFGVSVDQLLDGPIELLDGPIPK